MANKWNEFVTSVKLNTTEAEDKLKSLRKTTDDLIKKRDKLINGGGSKSDVNALQKQIDKNEKSMRQLEKQATNVIDVINNMDSSSLEQLLQAQRLLNKELQTTPQNTEYFHRRYSRGDKAEFQRNAKPERRSGEPEPGAPPPRFVLIEGPRKSCQRGQASDAGGCSQFD
jgi:hypothetical protein